ncbi:hypothetical protein DM02DRAFT_401108 [Periconia macrospinosa]|uniref:Protein YAE1 n=1 Tax=Periconia macrospinosa TaxID=97972 RepID=A0A2V1DPV5_9PLEO|nr:hypothetical protein DM02DRAFT_401108 [Periconia macrospinosa]
MLREPSPSLGPIHLPTGDAPPTPPQNDLLDDIYGSAPSSPLLNAENAPRSEEMLSDLPSRQRALDTDAYREGLSNGKGQFVQEGFDEGYSLGANLGILVGYVLGLLQGITEALEGHDKLQWKETQKLCDEAQAELAIEELLGQKWIDEEGIWRWEVEGKDEEVTFKEVAEQHPVMKTWMARIRDLAEKWGVDLKAAEGEEDES